MSGKNNYNYMSGTDAARIQSSEGKSGNSGGFSSRAQGAAANNANAGHVPATGSARGSGGEKGGSGNGGQKK